MTDNASRRRNAEGYEPRFDLDLAYGGEQAQLFVCDIAEAIRNANVEVKRDGLWHKTGNLYVEYECLKASGRWEKSGIAGTDALLWSFVLGDTETALFIPTGLLRQLARELHRKGDWYRVEERDGDHPTRGVKVPLGELVAWLARHQTQIARGAA